MHVGDASSFAGYACLGIVPHVRRMLKVSTLVVVADMLHCFLRHISTSSGLIIPLCLLHFTWVMRSLWVCSRAGGGSLCLGLTARPAACPVADSYACGEAFGNNFCTAYTAVHRTSCLLMLMHGAACQSVACVTNLVLCCSSVDSCR